VPRVKYGCVLPQFNRTVNKNVAGNCHRFVFAKSEDLLRRTVKTAQIDRIDRPRRLYRNFDEALMPDITHITGISFDGL
jgi:hypothetical protein